MKFLSLLLLTLLVFSLRPLPGPVMTETTEDTHLVVREFHLTPLRPVSLETSFPDFLHPLELVPQLISHPVTKPPLFRLS